LIVFSRPKETLFVRPLDAGVVADEHRRGGADGDDDLAHQRVGCRSPAKLRITTVVVPVQAGAQLRQHRAVLAVDAEVERLLRLHRVLALDLVDGEAGTVATDRRAASCSSPA
jgi:hypothetical protein